MTDTRVRRRRRRMGLGAALVAVATGAGVMASSAPVDPTARPELEPAPSALSVAWRGGLDGQAPCPEGLSRATSLRTDTFSGGIPLGQFNNGWARLGGAPGGEGGVARSTTTPGSAADYFYLPYTQTSPGTTTMFAYAQKGTTPGGWFAQTAVNGATFRETPSSGWSGRVRDITSATDDEGGYLGARFHHRPSEGGTTTWDLANVQQYTCRNNDITREGGEDRFDTAARIAGRFSPGVDTLYVASGETFPDALAGAAVAVRGDSPVLLVQRSRIPSATRAQLERLDAERIVLVGGDGTVSATVRQQLEEYTSTGEARRVGGDDRYETSAAITSAFYEAGQDTVFVTTGEDYPDALTGGAVAGRQNAPVLFVQNDRIPNVVRAELERLTPTNIVVVGGEGAVSSRVLADLDGLAGGEARRIHGSDRYATAAAVSNEFDPGVSRVYVATGEDFPDALSSSALAGVQGLPLLLAKPTDLTNSTRSAVDRLAPGDGQVIGGGSVLFSIVMDQLGRLTS